MSLSLDQMNELEAIRQLKSRYFRLMDTQQWEPWADCFTADVSALYEGAPRAAAPLARCETRDPLPATTPAAVASSPPGSAAPAGRPAKPRPIDTSATAAEGAAADRARR